MGFRSVDFNVHCLTHIAHCVRDGSLLWATSTFTFESHNRVLLNLFHGTQCVPQQISHTFLLKYKVASMTRSCMDGDSSASVKDLLVRLNDDVRYKHKQDANGLTHLGCEKLVTLDPCRIVALQNLLNIEVKNNSGKC